MCPACVVRVGRVFRSRATLVVVPLTLLQQWRDELRKHIDADLCVLVGYQSPINKFNSKNQVYEGLTEEYVYPRRLAEDYELVFVTYETLRR